MNNNDTFKVEDRVILKWKTDFDTPQHIKDAYTGSVLSVFPGNNTIIKVKFDGLEFTSLIPTQDLIHWKD